MKKRHFISPVLLFSGLFFITFMVSCSKKDGADGAVGPAGPTGPKGDAGTGDIIYSDWLDVSYKPDTLHRLNGTIDTIGFYANIDAPKLTLELLGTADIKAYINTNDASDPVIYPLPYNARSGLYIDITAYTQKLQLYSNADLSTLSASGKKYQQYRYMIIPGNINASIAAPVDWLDYASVKAYLRLKD